MGIPHGEPWKSLACSAKAVQGVCVVEVLYAHLIIVGDAADAVSVNFSARCKFSRLNAKIYHFTECIQCRMCVIYANVLLL